jgi:hypothetical protein
MIRATFPFAMPCGLGKPASLREEPFRQAHRRRGKPATPEVQSELGPLRAAIQIEILPIRESPFPKFHDDPNSPLIESHGGGPDFFSKLIWTPAAEPLASHPNGNPE